MFSWTSRQRSTPLIRQGDPAALAEYHLSTFLYEVVKQRKQYEEQRESLRAQRTTLRAQREELVGGDTLDEGAFQQTRRRRWIGIAVLGCLGLLGAALHFATLALLPSLTASVPVRIAAAFLLTVTLTGTGAFAVMRLLSLQHTDVFYVSDHEARHHRRLVGWMGLVVLIEAILVAFAWSGLLSFAPGAFWLVAAGVLTTALLPILGGVLLYRVLIAGEAYARTRTLRKIQTRIAQIDVLIRQDDAHLANQFQKACLDAWTKLKDDIARMDDPDQTTAPIVHSYQAFQDEAAQRLSSLTTETTTLDLIPSIHREGTPSVSRSARTPSMRRATTA